jgi:predicted Zn-dependent peptidase
MINRLEAPYTNEIANISFVQPEKWHLSNGIPVWGINSGSQELMKIDFLFEAGTWYQSRNLIAGLTNAFLNQGSKNYSAQEIAEVFDYRGAYLQLSADQQFGNISILTLNKYLPKILKVTADLMQNPTFPEKEIAAQIAKKKQLFKIENNKVKTLAQKKFSQSLFGIDHPYSNSNALEDYDSLTREDFIAFHSENYTAEKCKIVVAGNFPPNFKELLDNHFGKESFSKKQPLKNIEHIASPAAERSHFVEKADAMQCAIRMGKLVINREHPDFHGLTILVTILGGYFGSRLMANIREDKGYTYGIGAGIYSMPKASYFTISTEVGTDVCEAAIKEIYLEIDRLQNELVGDEELSIVRNYLLGESLRSFDGVFALSGSLKTLIEAGLDYDHYDGFIQKLKTITPEEIRELAVKYLQKEDIYEVVAGKR